MGKQWKQCQTLFWGAPKSLQMVTAAMKLKDKIEEMVFAGTVRNSSDLVVTNSRHKDALYKAKQSIEDALNAIESYMPLDFVEVDFKNIWDYLGYINGHFPSLLMV